MIAIKFKTKAANSWSRPQLNHSLAGNWPKPVLQFSSCTTVALVALCSTVTSTQGYFAEDLPPVGVDTVALFHRGF